MNPIRNQLFPAFALLLLIGSLRCEPPDSAPEPKDKAAELAELKERVKNSPHPYLSTRRQKELAVLLAEAEITGKPKRILGPKTALAHFLMFQGEIEQSIRHLEEAIALIESSGVFTAEVLTGTLYALALSYFRLAERENCVAHHSAESCIFPLVGGAVHVLPEGAQQASDTLRRVLELDPDYLEARWLYNVAHMALGTYPDQVPKDLLLPADRWAAEGDIGRFVDVAGELGINRYTRAGSVVLEDFDNDGLLDVLSCSFDPARSLRLYHNQGDGEFEDVTEAAGLRAQLGGYHLVVADVEGDGLLDVLVLRGGELHREGVMPNSLLRQVAPLRFDDVTAKAGIERSAPCRTAAFADIDQDGDLDLFIGYDSFLDPQSQAVQFPSLLFSNDGQGRFEDITEKAEIHTTVPCAAAVFGDYDGDRRPDLFLSLHEAPNELYRNLGAGRFEPMAEQLGVSDPAESRVAGFLDYDNDGDLDLWVTAYGGAQRARNMAAYFLDGTVSPPHTALYENQGDGSFRDVAAERGLDRVAYPLGANFGDLDHDGFKDLYLATGAGEMSALWPNLMLRNDRGQTFQNVTHSAGLGHLQKGNGIAFGDVDQDGDLDLFVQTGGYHLDDAFGDVLFQNPGQGNHWLKLELTGTRSNRWGIGAIVQVIVATPVGERRSIYHQVGSNSSFGGNSLRPHIGLGDAIKIDAVEVQWPAGGPPQRFTEVRLDSTLRCVEH